MDLYPLWVELDKIYCQSEYGRWFRDEQGASAWPWESNNPALVEVWEQLTRPENLAALEHWGRDLSRMNDFAMNCTVMAIETCRLRADGFGSVADCTPVAVIAGRERLRLEEPESINRG